MRLIFAITSLLLLLAANLFSAGDQVAQPDYFKTLVNPACSHCLDESKRRASELRDDDRVLAWIRGKYNGGAVPFRFFLIPYRVISDTYGVWIYDSDAGFVRGYEPSLDFTFHGWRNGIMVIKHKDGTLFSALSGVAFEGPRKGATLTPLPIIETDWGYWLKAYPGTVAYHMFDKYQPFDLSPAPNKQSLVTRPRPDERLAADEQVIGLALGKSTKAFPISILATNKILRDKIGDQEIVVLWYAPTRTAAIYAPQMENETAPDRLTLESNAQIPTAPFMDKETFSHWSIEGRAIEGPLQGKTLRWLPGVQCKWFAWAAENPKTEIYMLPTKAVAESPPPPIAKLIHGERLDWDQHVKTTGRIIRLDDAGKTVTAFADSDKKEHLVRLTPHTEFFVHGAWGTAADFVPGQRIYLIVLTDDQKEWTTAHAMADEISMQAMSRPFVLKQYAEHDHKLLFTDEKERKAPADLLTDTQTHFAVLNHEPLQSGQAYYFNSREQNDTHLAMAVLDAGSFDAERRTRLKQQRDLASENGLVATILEADEPNHQVALLVRRADAWYARLLKINDHVAVKSADRQSAGTQFTVADVRPDYARMRVRLEAGASEMAQFKLGEEVRLQIKIPEAAPVQSWTARLCLRPSNGGVHPAVGFFPQASSSTDI